MSWSDQPTYAQLQTIYRWFSWRLPTPLANTATKYLEEHATRREVSAEMSRLKKLFDSRTLDGETAFESKIWANFVDKEVLNAKKNAE